MHETNLHRSYIFWSREGGQKLIRGQAGSAMDEVQFRITAIQGTGKHEGTSGKHERWITGTQQDDSTMTEQKNELRYKLNK